MSYFSPILLSNTLLIGHFLSILNNLKNRSCLTKFSLGFLWLPGPQGIILNWEGILRHSSLFSNISFNPISNYLFGMISIRMCKSPIFKNPQVIAILFSKVEVVSTLSLPSRWLTRCKMNEENFNYSILRKRQKCCQN